MKKIGVIGSLNMDTFIQLKKIPEEGENIFAEAIKNDFGGKGGNSAIALKKMGCDVMFYGCVGNDYNARLIKKNLENYGIRTSDIKISEKNNTGTAYILLEKNGNNRIIVDPGANEDIDREDIRNLFSGEMGKCSLILIQLEISIEAIKEIISVCNEKNIKLIIDAGPIRDIKAEDLRGAYIVSPNKSELEALIGKKITTIEEIEKGAEELLNKGIENVLVKIGEHGSLFLNKKNRIYQKAYKVQAIDTTGAGDSYMAGLLKALHKGNDIKEAMDYGSICGAIAVTKIGAVSGLASEDDVKEFFDKYSTKEETCQI